MQATGREATTTQLGTLERPHNGRGENNGVSSTPPKEKGQLATTAFTMEEDGATTRLELLSLKEEPLGLTRENPQRVRK